MKLPTSQEKKEMILGFRVRFIHSVNSNKSSWNELTRKAKKELDSICERFYNQLQF